MSRALCISLSFLLIFLSFAAQATHLRAVDIQIEQIGCSGLTFRITINGYVRPTFTGPFFGGGTLTFGDGASIDVPDQPPNPRPDLGPEIGFNTFWVQHTYASPGTYSITYTETNRNEGILNMTASVTTAASVTAFLTVKPSIGCNSLPVMTIPPLDRACSGAAFSYSPGAYDADGDSLSFELVVPEASPGMPVTNYRYPDDQIFYSSHQPGNESGDGPPGFEIDPATGLLTWDAPGVQGEYAVAFRVTEWRWDPLSQEFLQISSLIRDMQIIVEDCNNNRPIVNIPADTCIVAGAPLSAAITATDPDGHPILLETYSEVYELPLDKSPATHEPAVPQYQPSIPPDTVRFNWETKCLHARPQPYRITFKTTDDPPSGPRLSTYGTWTVKVLAPAPEFDGIDVDFIKRHAGIRWASYECDAETIQIWRKVGTGGYPSNVCYSGLPQYLGYELIGEVDPSEQYFLDTNRDRGLAVGAAYCYRLLAILPGANNASIVSEEICLDPIQIDAPVITHVTVEETGEQSGSIRISWRSPFEINNSQFPGPYEYVVCRGTGLFSDELSPVSGRVSDTSFVDTGLNTDGSPYHYYVVLYSNTINDANYYPIDTSATASSVRLTATPQSESILLEWEADVPWSNVAPENSRHLIYRGVHGQPLTLIDSAEVTASGFRYVDRGTYQGIPIDPETYYCYYIVTRGTYGNPAIDLLENASQITCSYPINDLQPCAPAVTIDLLDCDEFLRADNCDLEVFENTISWEPPFGEGCRQDIVGYNVFAADSPDGEFTLVAENLRSTSYHEDNLPEPARCYRVQTIDKLGQTSDLSDAVCQDNCPYFALPNVFTPNDDGCNDLFRTYVFSDDDSDCPVAEENLCPRFVESLSVRIYNRWGIEVFHYRSSGDDGNAFTWDGKSAKGVLLNPAVYYYIADVNFNAIEPSRRNRKIKGWVHLIY